MGAGAQAGVGGLRMWVRCSLLRVLLSPTGGLATAPWQRSAELVTLARRGFCPEGTGYMAVSTLHLERRTVGN